MKALLLYALFITVGAIGAGAVGYFVEVYYSSALSLVVFLTLFFLNFVVSWLAVVLVIDGSLKDLNGEREQQAIEAEARKVAADRQSAA